MQNFRNFVPKRKLMFSQLLVLAALFSCKKEIIEDQSLQQKTSIAATSSASSNLIYEENFEGSSPFGTYVSKQFITDHAFTISSNPVFEGSKSGRFELRDGDPLNHDGTRAEVSFPYQSSLHRWYSFSAYFPAADYKYDGSDEVISQWHQSGGYSPSISLRGKMDRFQLIVKPKTDVSEKIDLGLIPKDQWNTFVFHINHSSNSDGLLEIWLNGKKIYNRVGVNMYVIGANGAKAPKWKMGIYKSDWNGAQTTDAVKRVIYFDNIRLGSEKATYDEMASAVTPERIPTPEPILTPAPTPTPTPTPTPSNSELSFTLVSAHTEKDIMALTEGSQVRLSQISVPKLNIRVNTPSSYKSVKFSLSGKQTKSVNDNTLPFTLQGDEGTNYGFGNWNPPATGTYTIEATPYTGLRQTGTAGAPYKITFSFIQ
jgi:hypothetical protein